MCACNIILAGVVKLVDAVDSKSTVSDDVSVRVRPSAPYSKKPLVDLTKGFFYWFSQQVDVVAVH